MPSTSQSMPMLRRAPSTPQEYVPRPCLVDTILSSLTHNQIVLISAPAGYGKTVLLAECLQQHPGPGLYLQFEPYAVQDTSLLRTYLHHLEKSCADPARRVLEVYEETRDANLAYRELIHAFTEDPRPVLLVLDDYPTTTDERINGLLKYLLNNLPPAWRILMSTRGKPDLPLARWMAEGRLAMYTERDLRFNLSETGQFMSVLLGRPLDTPELDLVERHLGGWALGLHLVGHSFRDKPPADFLHLLEQQQGLVWAMSEYFEHELMRESPLTPAERDFAQQAAILPELGVDICNSFAGIENAGETLDNLQRHGMYISQVDEAGTIHAYHPPFHTFLRERLYRRSGISTVRSLHLRAAQTYEQHQVWSQAITFYLLAGEYEAAVHLLEEQGPILLDRPTRLPAVAYKRSARVLDPVDALMDWLNKLPRAVLEARPLLLLLKAHAHNMRLEHKQARPILERLLASVQESLTTPEQTRAAIDWAFAAHAGGQFQAAVELLKKVLPRSETNPSVKAEAQLALSVNLNGLDDMQGALSAAETALRVLEATPEPDVSKALLVRILRHLAYLYRDVGDIQLARSTAERAYQMTWPHWLGGITAHTLNLRAYMLMHITCGNFAQAQRVGDEWEAMLREAAGKAGAPQPLAILRGRMALCHQEYELAEQYLSGIGVEHSDLTQLRLLQGRPAEALRLADLAVRLTEHHPPLVHTIAQTWLGIVESQRGNVKRGREILEQSVDYFHKKGLVFWEAGAQLHLTWLLARLGQTALARPHLAAALAYGARVDTKHFSFWHPDVLAFACAEALAAEIETEYVVRLATTQLKVAQARYFQPLTHHPVEAVRRLARHIYTQLGAHAEVEVTVEKKRLATQVETLVRQRELLDEGALKLTNKYHLTPREIEVFVCYVTPNIRSGERRVNEAIASRLYLSELTVRTYISTILKKLEVPGRDRLQLRNWAITERIIPSEQRSPLESTESSSRNRLLT